MALIKNLWRNKKKRKIKKFVVQAFKMFASIIRESGIMT